MTKLKDLTGSEEYASLRRLLASTLFNQRSSLTNVYEYCDMIQRTAARTDEESIDDIVSSDVMEMLNNSGRMARYLEEMGLDFEKD